MLWSGLPENTQMSPGRKLPPSQLFSMSGNSMATEEIPGVSVRIVLCSGFIPHLRTVSGLSTRYHTPAEHGTAKVLQLGMEMRTFSLSFIFYIFKFVHITTCHSCNYKREFACFIEFFSSYNGFWSQFSFPTIPGFSPPTQRHTLLSFSLENKQANKQTKNQNKKWNRKKLQSNTHIQTPKHKTHKNVNPLYTWKSNPTFLQDKVSKMCAKPDQCSLV